MMMAKDTLGRRLKRVRESRQLTLKTVEAAAGISATHISEIERGKSAPTVGVLLRLARALGKAPAYFVEEAELGDMSVVKAEDRVRQSFGTGGAFERLTTGIPGGRLEACVVTLQPGGARHTGPHVHHGAEAALVLEGRARFRVGDETVELETGDAVHYDAALSHAFENASSREPAALLWVSTGRDTY